MRGILAEGFKQLFDNVIGKPDGVRLYDDDVNKTEEQKAHARDEKQRIDPYQPEPIKNNSSKKKTQHKSDDINSAPVPGGLGNTINRNEGR